MITPYGNPLCKAAVTLCAAIFAAALTNALEAQTGRITGTVTAGDAKGPLAGATVEVLGPTLKKKMGAVSRADGQYAVENVPAGAYTVRATSAGYRGETVKGVAVAAGASVEVDFRMTVAPYELGEMVVSASRHAENIVDAPASIVKVDGKDAERYTGANSYISLLRNVKGIDYTQTGILLEKFNARGYNSATAPNRMPVVTDGIFNDQGIANSVPKDDLRDVEVIVGPGSALYGPDAVSGVISITTKDPKESQGTTLSMSGGSQNIFKGRFRHAGLRDKWGWKASGEYQRARDFELVNRFFNADSSASVTDDPNFDVNNLRSEVGLFYYPDDRSRLSFSAGASLTNNIIVIETTRVQVKNLSRNYQRLAYTSPHLYLILYRTETDNGGSYGLGSSALYRLAGFSPEEAYQRARAISNRTRLGAESRCNFEVPHLKTHFNVGVDFRQDRLKSNTLDAPVVTVRQAGFYGLSETVLSEKVRLTLASRLDVHEVYSARFSPKLALIFKPRPVAAFRVTFNRAFRSPSILQHRYQVASGPVRMVRGNSKGFKFGTTTGGPLPPQFSEGIPKLEPENNTTLELGVKGVLASKVLMDVSGYTSWHKNFISPLRPIGDFARGIVTLDANGNPRKGEQTMSYINFGRQKVLGFDAGIDVYATDRITFKGNISFIKADKLEDAGGIDQPFNTPRTVFNLGLSCDDLLAKRATLDVSLHYVSKFDFRSGINVGAVQAYTVMDMNLGYRTKHGITYRLSVTNLFDNKHIEMVGAPKIRRVMVGELQYAF